MNVGWLFLSLEGRINRAKYLIARFVLLIPFFGLLWAVFVIGDGIGDRVGSFAILLVVVLLLDVVVAWASLALDVKRLHDHDISGWWLLVGLIPVLGGVVLISVPIALSFMRGDRGANKFGPDPTEASQDLAHPVTAKRRLVKRLFEVREPTWM